MNTSKQDCLTHLDETVWSTIREVTGRDNQQRTHIVGVSVTSVDRPIGLEHRGFLLHQKGIADIGGQFETRSGIAHPEGFFDGKG